MNTGSISLKILGAVLLSLCFGAAIAALPSSFNYQGHLTDTGGVPVDGTVSLTFNIYDVDAGGLPLWSDIRVTTVQQGVFSVELGAPHNPFPVSMFETPLWIGLVVESDAEMIPRRPVTSTAFAFKAGDANTLDGSTAASLDQAAHVADMANPHNVTPAQIGASTGPHTVDTNAATECKAGQYLRGDGLCVNGFLDADGVDAYNSAFDTEAEIDAAVANNGYSTGAHTVDTNAAILCASGQYLRGDGSCVSGFLDADGVDAYNSAFDTEAEIDAAVADNGYSTGAHTVNTNAATLCASGRFLNGDGTCDLVPVNYPEVNYADRVNSSFYPLVFESPHHELRVWYTGAANDFVIYSKSTEYKRVVIDDGTGTTVADSMNTIGATVYKNVHSDRIATIDLVETSNDNLYRYRCMTTGSNLVMCTQEIY